MTKIFLTIAAFAAATLIADIASAHASHGGGWHGPQPQPARPVVSAGVGVKAGGLLGVAAGAKIGGRGGLLNVGAGVRTPVAEIGLDLNALSGGVGGHDHY